MSHTTPLSKDGKLRQKKGRASQQFSMKKTRKHKWKWQHNRNNNTKTNKQRKDENEINYSSKNPVFWEYVGNSRKLQNIEKKLFFLSFLELMLRYPSISDMVLPDIEKVWDSIEHYSIGKAALVWMYGEYGEVSTSTPRI